MPETFKNKNIQAFFALLKSGLWEEDILLSTYGTVDFNEVYRLAGEQSVVGLIAAGLEHVLDVKVPQSVALLFASDALQIEQRNKAMNRFIASMVEKMRIADIYTLLVKGQGIAQCYERPLWRSSGDIDLLLSESNYQKAKDYLIPRAQKVEKEHLDRLHIALEINSWEVELHGTLHPRLGKKVDSFVDTIQSDGFRNDEVRVWNNNGTDVYLPSVNNDVIFIFTHIIQHFFHGGVGLRQICDWCRLLWKYSNEIDERKLIHRLKRMKLMTEWKVLSSLAVNYLGMPEDAYHFSNSLSKKASRFMTMVLEAGNFGHNRDDSYYYEKSYLIKKSISFWRHTKDGLLQIMIFPIDSIKNWNRKLFKGLSLVMNNE